MDTKDPIQTDASTRWWESPRLDEAPTLTTRQHLEYLVGLITREWKKTIVKWHNVSADTVSRTLPKFDELEFSDPDEDSVIKIHVGSVPKSIVSKVDALGHMQRIGLPNLAELMELVNEDLAKSPFAPDSDESGNDNETSFTDMLIELAMNRIYEEYVEKQEIGFNLTVVFVDKSGNMRLKQCRIQHDTDFASFLGLMDKYPQEFDLNVTWAASFWDEKIRALKEKGYNGHPKLVEIEQHIAAHKARDYDAGPKWMFYKTNQQVAYAKSIDNAIDLKKVLEVVANPSKNNRLACMVRSVDKDLILICDELKFFELRLQDTVPFDDLATPTHTPSSRSDQRYNNEQAPGIDSFTTDDCSFDFLARTLGVGFNFAFLNDDDDDDDDDAGGEDDKQLPWGLAKNVDKN